jgi:hypothetical protein
MIYKRTDLARVSGRFFCNRVPDLLRDSKPSVLLVAVSLVVIGPLTPGL